MGNSTNTVGQWVTKSGDSGDDYFYGITTDSSNNYVAVGYEQSSTSNDEALIAKFNTDGTLLWQKKLGGSSGEYFYGITTDSSNNYIAVGYENSSATGYDEALIAKFDADGNLLWRKKLGGSNDSFSGVTTDSANNYIAAGYEKNSIGNNEALIAKFDSDGNLLWQKKLGGGNTDYFNGITTDSSNNYIAVGYEHSRAGNYEALIAKFDSDGNLLWQKKLGGSKYDTFNGITTDSSNNYIAVGYENSGNNDEALIAKFDTGGNLLWQKKLGGSNYDLFTGITTDIYSNYVAVGYENSTRGNNDEALIAKFDTDGTLLWQKKLSGGNYDYFYGITTDIYSDYVAVGYENSAGKYEALIAKFDTNGTIVACAIATIPQLSLKDSALTLSTLSLTH